MIEKLKDLAIRFKIESEGTVGHAAKLSAVIKVLSDIQASYHSFLKIEFLKQNDFKAATASNPLILNTLVDDLELLIVDLKFSSFETAVAPNILDDGGTLFKDEVKDWKRQSFGLYRDIIIGGDYNDHGYVRNVGGRYSDEERRAIFKPLFSSATGGKKGYKVNILDNKGNLTKRLVLPVSTSLQEFYVPTHIYSSEPAVVEKTVQIYAKVREKEGEINLTKGNIRQVYFMEEMEHDTYPFKKDVIRLDDIVYVLYKPIIAEVTWDEIYKIEYPELNISVWGETREEVEEAFAFTFHSLVENYVNADDKVLTSKAQGLKRKVSSLIKSTINETA